MTLFLPCSYSPILFQLKSSRRGWRRLIQGYVRTVAFQLTSSRRGWRCLHEWCYWQNDISTHILTKRMTRPYSLHWRAYQYFNSHPHEEDDRNQYSVFSSVHYFNSHPHEEDDVITTIANTVSIEISTHILTKRMTCKQKKHGKTTEISTHILTKRMTFPCFHHLFTKNISTHILTKRMTHTFPALLSSLYHFNSHPHEEDDYTTISIPSSSLIFQLTSSRRGWRSYLYAQSHISHFNSHPHEEDDRDKNTW